MHFLERGVFPTPFFKGGTGYATRRTLFESNKPTLRKRDDRMLCDHHVVQNAISTTLSACFNVLVSSSSAREGSATPLGWQCENSTAAQLWMAN